jgi:DNA-binding NarL/FixJ family response regulator
VTEPRTIRVLVCDDVESMLVALRAVLELAPGIEVVGEARNGEEAVEQARRLRPDVVLLDLTMPGMDGLEALPQLRRAAPRARVVVLSGHEGRPIEEAVRLGADRSLVKGAEPDAIVAAVAEAADGAAAESPPR